MRVRVLFSIVVSLSLVLVAVPAPTTAQSIWAQNPQAGTRVPTAFGPERQTLPDWGGAWQEGPATAFQFWRFDGEYYPGTGKVYFLGGRLADGTTDGSVWSYDPATGAYADMGVDLPTPISNYDVNLLQDAAGAWGLFVFCGRTGAGGQNLAPQIYYPDANTAVQLGAEDNYPGTESTCSSALNAIWGNKVYLAGGFNATANTDETWIFDPTAAAGSRWTQLASALLSAPRAYIMSAVADGLIYAIGGNYYDASSTQCGAQLCNVNTVEVLDPSAAAPVWDDAAVADLPELCSEGRAWGFDSDSPYMDPDGTSFAAKIVSTCGYWPDENNHVLVYDVGLNSWANFPYLITDRRDLAGAFLPETATGTGVPGLWVWGGRKDADTTVLQSSEFYSVTVAAAPDASFTADRAEGCAPLEVQFTDTSTGNPTGWFWDLGDGGTSTEQNPLHTYVDPGSLVVTLTVTNAIGSDTATGTITVNETPDASFTWPTPVYVGQSVQLTDTSTGSPVSWLWDTGDGYTYTVQNPQHTFYTAGYFAVSLTVTTSLGCADTVQNRVAVQNYFYYLPIVSKDYP